MKLIVIAIYENGNVIGNWTGMVEDPKRVRTVIDPDSPADTIVNLARRSGIYAEPKPHMRRHQDLLDRHAAISLYIHQHNDECKELDVYAQSIAEVWWTFYGDDHDTNADATAFRMHLDRIEKNARLAYATWLMLRFAALGNKAARWSVQNALAALRAGRMRQPTFDNKIAAARHRLDLMEKPK